MGSEVAEDGGGGLNIELILGVPGGSNGIRYGRTFVVDLGVESGSISPFNPTFSGLVERACGADGNKVSEAFRGDFRRWTSGLHGMILVLRCASLRHLAREKSSS